MGKLIEVDEDEYNRSERIRATLAQIAKNPQGARLLEQAHKVSDPNVPTPLMDSDKVVNEPVAAIRKEFDDFRKSVEDEKLKSADERTRRQLETRYESGRQKLRDQKWTEDGIKAVEGIMEKEGILDHEIAAAYFEKQNPPQAPSMPGGTGSWNFLDPPTEGNADSDFIKKLIDTKGQSDNLTEHRARAALTEFRGSQSRR